MSDEPQPTPDADLPPTLDDVIKQAIATPPWVWTGAGTNANALPEHPPYPVHDWRTY